MIPTDIIKKYYKEGSGLYNILVTHGFSVADKALEIVRMHPEWEINKDFVYESALLHDIGIYLTDAPKIQCFGKYPYICHGYLGADLLRKEGLEKHAWVCERHTGVGLTRENIKLNNLPLPDRNLTPETLEEKLICFADKFYSKSKLNQVKTVDQIKKHLSKYGTDSTIRFENMVKLFLG
jgi:uncharacterized protein